MANTQQLREVRLEDREVIQKYLDSNPPKISEHTFTECYVWRETRPILWTTVDDSALLLFETAPSGGLLLLGDPIGKVSFKKVLEVVPDLKGMHRISSEFAQQVKEEVPDFIPESTIDWDDYVYLADELADLPGSKFSKRRHVVSKAVSDFPDAHYEMLTAEHMPQCLELLQEWCKEKDCGTNPSICAEYHATNECLRNWKNLPTLFGGGVWVNNRLVAFAIGEKLSPDTVVCHFEKAKPSVAGAAALINKWLADQSRRNGFKFVNREQDCGSIGLRQAKKQYNPVKMVSKFRVALKEGAFNPAKATIENSHRCAFNHKDDVEW